MPKDIPDITPETHPDHHTVGRRFKGWDGNVFFCKSHDRCGYWMVNEKNSKDRRNVSERAIGRTFHLVRGENNA